MAVVPKETPVSGSEPLPAVPAGTTMAGELPEKPKIEGGFAVVGHLRVEASHYGQVREALIYESKNPETTAIVKSLVDGPKTTTVTINHTADNSMTPLGNGNAEVHWDPQKMHIASNGAQRSPATRLGHELDHAEEWTHHPQRLIDNAKQTDPKYGNLEEKRVITGWERRTVPMIGEGIRYDHDYGKGNFEAKGVTSHEPILHAKINGHDTTLSNGFSQDGKIVAITADKVVQDMGHGTKIEYNRAELEAYVDPAALQAARTSGQSVHIGVGDGKFNERINAAPGHDVQQPVPTR
jgi:hypothetical protein